MRLFANYHVGIFDLSLYAFRDGVWASFVIGCQMNWRVLSV